MVGDVFCRWSTDGLVWCSRLVVVESVSRYNLMEF
jgi:hypothetical protein